MTRRRIAEPTTKVTMNLFSQDVARMKDLYPNAGFTAAIRMLVRQHLLKLDRKEAQMLDTMLVGDVDIDIG